MRSTLRCVELELRRSLVLWGDNAAPIHNTPSQNCTLQLPGMTSTPASSAP